MIAATTNTDAVRQYLAGLGARADAALRDGAAVSADRLRNAAERNLSGSVLKVRTGTLRASLAAQSSAEGGTVGAGAPYAAFQEYGFSGTETVRAHLRRRAKGGLAPVRTYSRRVDYPAHSYLRAALSELAPDIRQTIADAIAGALAP
jgi:phage gpG-like protein